MRAVVEPLEQLCHCTLPAPAAANQRHCLPRGGAQVNARQHSDVRPLRVIEINPVEGGRSVHRTLRTQAVICSYNHTCLIEHNLNVYGNYSTMVT